MNTDITAELYIISSTIAIKDTIKGGQVMIFTNNLQNQCKRSILKYQLGEKVKNPVQYIKELR